MAAVLIWVTACSGIQNTVPAVNESDTRSALVEIESFTPSDAADPLSHAEAQQRLFDAYRNIKPAAVEVCRHTGESRVCAWDVSYSDLGEYNAFATTGYKVVVFHGIISETDNESELAYVLAHELAHHIADHINESRSRANTGMMITGLGVAALTHGSSGCATYTCLSALQNAAQASMQVGGNIGVLMFSVEQEKEADYLAAYILARSGYDLAPSRTMLLKFGAKSDQTETGFLNSHPAGPERLASYDKSIAEIQNDPDGLPGDEPVAQSTVRSEEIPAVESDASASTTAERNFNARNCRIYLPKENICIH